LRSKVSIHVNIFYVTEIPIPVFDPSNEYSQEIIRRVGSLICTTKEYDALKKELEVKESETDESKRKLLIAEVNAYAAKLYNLSRDEFEYILSAFPIVDKQTKLDVISAFDKIEVR